MAAQRKWPGWFKASPEQRLQRRRYHFATFGALLVGAIALSFIRRIDIGLAWYLFSTAPYVATCGVQIIGGRENLWLERFGFVISGLILALGWHVTGIDGLLILAAIMPLIVVLDVFMHRKWSGLHAR